MDSALLETKVRIPPQARHSVLRPRLIDAIEQELPHYRLALVSAPAGYGKTTLLEQWAQASRYRVAWLTIDQEDNDSDRFFRSLLAAWEQAQPGVRAGPLGILLGSIAPDDLAVLTAFLNATGDARDHMVVVLDDYHLITEPVIHQALTFLLDHLPPAFHIVLATRAEPPLPVARYRARQALLEFGTADLQFQPGETLELFRRLGLDLSPDEMESLHAQLEGWAAGLQLVSLTLRHDREALGKLMVSGRHRFIADYLREDVLAHLPGDRHRFLLQTSILDRLCASLCEAVTGSAGGQAMLESLERENLFLVPLDDRREWFRYHRLFADVLQDELNRRLPDEIADLHRRATGWYLEHDVPEPAFEHAIAANDPDLVIRIFERYGNLKLHGGELTLVARWLEALPEAWYAAHPVLSLFRAGLLAFTGPFDTCQRCIDEVEQRLAPAEAKDVRWQLAMVAAVRCFIACIQNDVARAEAHADQALHDLRDESLSFRASIYHALGDTYRRNGRWGEAKECYLKVLTFTGWPGYRVQSAHVLGALADLELRQGHLRSASGYWRQALAAIQDQATWGRLPLPVTGWVFIRLGELLHEWNELTDAWEYLSQGLERAELGGDVRTLIAGCVISARLELTEGNIAAAVANLERARPLVEQAPFPDWLSQYERCQVELWLAQDQLREAVAWTYAMLRDGALEARPDSERARLALARVLIVKADGPSRKQALNLLARLHEVAETEGRLGVQIEALALLALAHWQAGDRMSALTALERALRLAEPEGYLRLFADLGMPMARMLQEARARGVLPEYVGALLAACGAGIAASSAAMRTLPEPLTAREQEILRLIAAGLTNREIGDRLFISPETVKKHTGSIFGKLGVGRRTEAVARARALDLLG